jgi:glycosyltransferase involved in cell wall biosynthesis
MMEIFGYIFVLYITGLNGLIQNVVILLVHNFYKSTHLGGEDHVFREELKALRKSLGPERVLSYEVQNDQASLPKIVFHLLFPFFHALKIRDLVRKNKVDIVHFHNDFPMITLWMFRLLRGLGCVRIQTLHNYRHWCANGILYRNKAGACQLCIEKKSRLPAIRFKCYRNSTLQSALVAMVYSIQDFFKVRDEADVFFCLSEHEKKMLTHFGVRPSKLILKPNAVYDETPFGSVSIKEIELIYVGRIEESKGILKVLESLNSSTQSKLTVVGHSDELPELEKRYPGVKFLGKKSHADTQKLIQKSRFLIHSSLCYETFGLTMIEAMALGTPVIGFPIGTRTEFIKDGVNGFLIQENRIQEGIEAALNATSYSDLQKNAVDFSKKFLRENIIKQQVAIYQDVLRQNGGKSK